MKKFAAVILKYFKRLDKALLIAIILCSCVGIVLLYSLYRNGTILPSVYKTQFLLMLGGIAVCFVLSAIDYAKLAKLWFLYVPVALGCVMLTFTSLGKGVDGADDVAWIDLGFMSFQPSELLKLAFIMSFSYHLYKVGDDMNKPLNMLLLCLHGAIPMLLIVKQGDHGTALVFGVMFIAMIFCAGISVKYIIAAAVLSVPAGYVCWNYVFGRVQKERILVLFNPGSDPAGLEYQPDLGKAALSSGGLFGQGIFNTEKSMVPEIYNDFIFAYVGQALGFVGCVGLIILLAFICLKLIANSRMAREPLGKNICVGVFALIFTHCFMNIGMVMKVMPVIGIPLPFVSAGGTALLSMFTSIGLAMSVYSHRVEKRKKYNKITLRKRS